MNIQLEQWYSMDNEGKMTGIGIRGEELATITPKKRKIPIKHLRASIPPTGRKMRRIPSWDNLNYTIFMCKYTNHYGHHLDLYAAYQNSRMPTSDDEEARLDVIYEAADQLFDWES